MSNRHDGQPSGPPAARRAQRPWATSIAIGGLVAGLGLTGLAPVAQAAVDVNHTVLVSKDDSIVLAEGFQVGDPVEVAVERGGVTIGTATGVAEELQPDRFPGVGFFEVNHAAAPTVCWDEPNTPEILAGDVVRVTSGDQGSEIVDEVTVSDIEVTEGPTQVAAGTVTVKAHLTRTPAPPLASLGVEVRSLDPVRFRVLAPGDGTIRYDDPVNAPGDFTARFSGLTPEQTEALLNAFEVTASYLPQDNEGTIATFGAEAGSEDPACPPAARRAVTDFSPEVLNAANSGSGLTVSGLSQSSSAVDVTLTDDDPATPDSASVTRSATLSPPDEGGSQTWTAAFTPAEVSGLNATITAAGRYTDAATGTVLSGATNSLLRDVVAPAAPTASPPGGEYNDTQSVRLSPADEADAVRYRVGTTGSTPDPTAASPLYAGEQISITASQTIKARAFDAAGNPGPVLVADYVIQRDTAPTAPVIGTAVAGTAGGAITATARWARPASDGGQLVNAYRVTALRMSVTGSVVSRTESAKLPASARSHDMTLAAGKYRFRVQAYNAIGEGPLSARSNRVIAR